MDSTFKNSSTFHAFTYGRAKSSSVTNTHPPSRSEERKSCRPHRHDEAAPTRGTLCSFYCYHQVWKKICLPDWPLHPGRIARPNPAMFLYFSATEKYYNSASSWRLRMVTNHHSGHHPLLLRQGVATRRRHHPEVRRTFSARNQRILVRSTIAPRSIGIIHTVPEIDVEKTFIRMGKSKGMSQFYYFSIRVKERRRRK